MEETILDGMFFVTKTWQGRIVGNIGKGLYAVQLYSWVDGAPSCVKLVSIEQMMDWDFYNKVDEWHKAAGEIGE